METEIKLNLGCGVQLKEGFVNVDKYGDPDLRHVLEVFPWPWPDSCVREIEMNHVLEHLGRDTDVYLNIIKELYRVSKDQALIHITVPHPRHDDFLNDPTHVRPITPDGLGLFSKKNNEEWIKGGNANTPLGVFLNVDFEVTHIHVTPDPIWIKLLADGKKSEAEFASATKNHNNVIKQYRITVKVVK